MTSFMELFSQGSRYRPGYGQDCILLLRQRHPDYRGARADFFQAESGRGLQPDGFIGSGVVQAFASPNRIPRSRSCKFPRPVTGWHDQSHPLDGARLARRGISEVPHSGRPFICSPSPNPGSKHLRRRLYKEYRGSLLNGYYVPCTRISDLEDWVDYGRSLR